MAEARAVRLAAPVESRSASHDVAPEISVVMPTHQAEAFLEDAVEIILGQTWDDLELIIAVDSSTDGSEAIARAAAARDARVHVLVVDERSVSKTRNAALAVARGRYIALMDADDVAYPERLERQRAVLESDPELVLVGCWMRRITPEGLPMSEVRVGPRSVEAFRRLDRTRSLIRLYGTVAFFRKSMYERVDPFDTRFEPMEDAEMWDRMAEHGPVVVLPEVLQDYRQHAESLSVQRLALQRKVFRYLTARHAARLRGEELDWGVFDRRYRRWSAVRGIDDRLRGTSMGLMRSARIAAARGRHVPAGLTMVLAVLTHPGRFVRRLFPGAPHV